MIVNHFQASICSGYLQRLRRITAAPCFQRFWPDPAGRESSDLILMDFAGFWCFWRRFLTFFCVFLVDFLSILRSWGDLGSTFGTKKAWDTIRTPNCTTHFSNFLVLDLQRGVPGTPLGTTFATFLPSFFSIHFGGVFWRPPGTNLRGCWINFWIDFWCFLWSVVRRVAMQKSLFCIGIYSVWWPSAFLQNTQKTKQCRQNEGRFSRGLSTALFHRF